MSDAPPTPSNELEDGTDRFVDFAHGTTCESGLGIITDGLNHDAGIGAMVGSQEPGSFFTVKVNPDDPMAALETAAFWGKRHGDAGCVVVCRLPQSVVEGLESAGSLVHTSIPYQSVFRPGSFGIVNREAQWFMVNVG